MKRLITKLVIMAACMALFIGGSAQAADREIAGVTFAEQKTIAGKTLTLNGVALRKALVFIKVFAGGFYLETQTFDAEEAITSEQVKHFHLHYLTDKATAKKLQEGFLEAMEKANPPELVEKHRDKIDLYASWLDEDMAPGATSKATYVPGVGLTLEYKGVVKGTIPGEEFARMYFRYNLGENADSSLRKGYLGK
ncbi:MAG: chalcone isomerase family protein [Desulfobacterales bacterium]|nr:chalcone isomerase family protein [Desulfobacterales bacterium]